MPKVSSNNQCELKDNRNKSILVALNKYKKDYSTNHKRSSVNSLAESYNILRTTLRHVIKNDSPPNHSELSEARAQRANAIIVKNHFDKLKQIIDENSLTAMQIWNMDETRFVLVPKLEKVIAKKGACQVHKISHGNSHKHISVAPTISVARSYIPPLIIYKGVRVISGLLKGAPPVTVMGFTSTSTGIWPFNPEAISSDHLDPFLTTEQFDIVPSSLTLPSNSQQLTQSNESLSESFTHSNCSHLTHSNAILLEKENEILLNENVLLKNENKMLKTQFAVLKEELETYKNPRTCSLCSALKYPVPRVSHAEAQKDSLNPPESESPLSKKRKTLPFCGFLLRRKVGNN
ncbi:3979_t:CDS:2 [Cetraspora pellucida]|uniref:3979_t:CDS:1 n=1 Tax=Cetraspora pellucida TaxID=1433469 RepID=A0A9N9H1H0_9GLOM|nr:3979_t:CDS:2 [Cetraspora pellucida]